MRTSEQWLKTMPGASWRDLDQLKEWIEAIQGEAFNEGFRQSHRMLGCECVEEPISSLLKKPQSK